MVHFVVLSLLKKKRNHLPLVLCWVFLFLSSWEQNFSSPSLYCIFCCIPSLTSSLTFSSLSLSLSLSLPHILSLLLLHTEQTFLKATPRRPATARPLSDRCPWGRERGYTEQEAQFPSVCLPLHLSIINSHLSLSLSLSLSLHLCPPSLASVSLQVKHNDQTAAFLLLPGIRVTSQTAQSYATFLFSARLDGISVFQIMLANITTVYPGPDFFTFYF